MCGAHSLPGLPAPQSKSTPPAAHPPHRAPALGVEKRWKCRNLGALRHAWAFLSFTATALPQLFRRAGSAHSTTFLCYQLPRRRHWLQTTMVSSSCPLSHPPSPAAPLFHPFICFPRNLLDAIHVLRTRPHEAGRAVSLASRGPKRKHQVWCAPCHPKSLPHYCAACATNVWRKGSHAHKPCLT